MCPHFFKALFRRLFRRIRALLLSWLEPAGRIGELELELATYVILVVSLFHDLEGAISMNITRTKKKIDVTLKPLFEEMHRREKHFHACRAGAA